MSAFWGDRAENPNRLVRIFQSPNQDCFNPGEGFRKNNWALYIIAHFPTRAVFHRRENHYNFPLAIILSALPASVIAVKPVPVGALSGESICQMPTHSDKIKNCLQPTPFGERGCLSEKMYLYSLPAPRSRVPDPSGNSPPLIKLIKRTINCKSPQKLTWITSQHRHAAATGCRLHPSSLSQDTGSSGR
jgi:hypothetical protein